MHWFGLGSWCLSEAHTWDDVVVEGPGDFRCGDASGPTGQQEALSLVERDVSQQLTELRVGLNRQSDRLTVLAHRV